MIGSKKNILPKTRTGQKWLKGHVSLTKKLRQIFLQDDSHEIEGYELEGFLNDLYQKKHKVW